MNPKPDCLVIPIKNAHFVWNDVQKNRSLCSKSTNFQIYCRLFPLILRNWKARWKNGSVLMNSEDTRIHLLSCCAKLQRSKQNLSSLIYSRSSLVSVHVTPNLQIVPHCSSREVNSFFVFQGWRGATLLPSWCILGNSPWALRPCEEDEWTRRTNHETVETFRNKPSIVSLWLLKKTRKPGRMCNSSGFPVKYFVWQRASGHARTSSGAGKPPYVCFSTTSASTQHSYQRGL